MATEMASQRASDTAESSGRAAALPFKTALRTRYTRIKHWFYERNGGSIEYDHSLFNGLSAVQSPGKSAGQAQGRL